MVLAIAMGDMGTVTNDEKRGHVSWVTSTGQHKLVDARCGGEHDRQDSTFLWVHPAMVTRSVAVAVSIGIATIGRQIGRIGRKIGHRCLPWSQTSSETWDRSPT